MNNLKFRCALRKLSAIAFIALAGTHSAFAATRTWTGDGSTANFSNGGNWNGSTDIVSGDSWTFGAAGTGGWLALNFNYTGYSSAGITFISLAPAYTMSSALGYSLTLAGNLTNNSASVQTINMDMVLSATRTFSGTGDVVLGGNLSGAGGLIKAGTGTLVLNGDNSYAGNTTVSAGTLQLGPNNGIPNGAGNGNVSVSAGAILDINGYGEKINGLSGGGTVDNSSATAASLIVGDADQTSTFSGVITNSGGALSLEKTGTGTLTLSGANTYTGDTLVTLGTLALSNASALAGSTLDTTGAGTVTFSAAGTNNLGGLKGSGNLANGGHLLSIGANKQDTTYSGAITGTGGLTKVGSGTLTLSGSNGYSGITLVSAGDLTLGNTDALAGSTLDASGNGTVNFFAGTNHFGGIQGSGGIDNGGNLSEVGFNNQNTVFSGVMSGSGGLTKYGSGTLTLSGNNTFSGRFTLHQGTVLVGNNNALGTGNAVTFDNSYEVFLASSSANAYTLAQAIALWSTNLTLGQASGGTGALTFSGAVSLPNGYNRQITVANSADTISGNISDSGSLTKAGSGTLTLSGNNTYYGDTLVSAGTLVLGSANALAGSTLDTAGPGTVSFFAGTNNIGGLKGGGAIANEGNLMSVGANNQSATYSGVMSGAGGLTKTGTGALTLSGNNSFNGGFTLNGGTVLVGHTNALGVANTLAINAGTLASSSGTAYSFAQAVTVGGNFTLGQASGGTGVITLSGAMNFGAATRTITVANSSGIFSGPISGTGGLTKAGAGSLTLSGSNTYSGDTLVSAGTLTLGHANALAGSALDTTGIGTVSFFGGTNNLGGLKGSGPLSNGSHQLSVGANNQDTAYSGVLSGTGGLTKVGSGALTLTGANSFEGGLTLSTGTVLVGHASALGTGTSLTLNGGTLASSSSTAYTLAQTSTVGGDFTLGKSSVGTGALTLSGAMNLGNATRTITVANSKDVISGVISGSGGLTKNGTGTLALSGNNNFTGGFTLNAGAIQVGHANALGVGNALAINGGNLSTNDDGIHRSISQPVTVGGNFTLGNLVGGTGELTLAGTMDLGNSTRTITVKNIADAISGVISNGGLTKAGTGTLTLSGNNTFTGNTRVDLGTLALASENALAASTLDTDGLGAVSFYNGTNNIGGLMGSGPIDNGGNLLSIGPNTQDIKDTTYSGVMSGAGGLTKVGRGNLTLSGNNSFTGATSIDYGAISASSLNSVSSNRSASSSLGAPVTVANGTISFLGSYAELNYIGAGETTDRVIHLAGSTSMIYNHGVGVLKFASDLTASGTGGKTLYLGYGVGEFAGKIVDSTEGGATGVRIYGVDSYDTWTLSGANTYSGHTEVLGSGTLKLGADEVIPHGMGKGNVSVSTFCIFDLNACSETINGLSGGGTVDNKIAGNVTLTVGDNDQTSTFSGVIKNTQGSMSLTKIGFGTLTLSGNNTFTGVTRVNQGTLALESENALAGSTLDNGVDGMVIFSEGINIIGGLQGSGPLHTGAGAIPAYLTVGGNNQSTTYSGRMSGLGGLTKVGSGTLTLTGSNDYTGTTTVSTGTLVINDSSESTVTVAHGATLGGSGTIRGNTTISGTHTPGNSPGLQTFKSNLTYEDGSTVVWELSANTADPAKRGINFDGITVDVDLTFSGTTTLSLVFDGTASTVDWSNNLWATDHAWLFFSVGGTTLGTVTMGVVSADMNGVLLAAVRPGASFSTTTSGNNILVSYTAVPEPSTLMLTALAGVAGLLWRRRKTNI